MALSRQQQPTVPLVLRIFFLYYEPFAAITGALQALFLPTSLLSIILPASTSISLDRIHYALLSNIAGQWFHFGVAEAVVLRLTPDLRIWSAFIGSMIFADLGYIYAPQRVVPGWDVHWRADRWRWEDWVNFATTNLGLVMKVAFLVWAWREGRGGRTVGEGKKHEE